MHPPDAAQAETQTAPKRNGQWHDLFISAGDGLRLHARDYGSRASAWLPVICLPGLSRNAADFHELAMHLASHRHRPRRVLSLDYRGRGQSGFDRNWRNYTPLTETSDLLDVMTAAGVPHAAFVGTSRGGLIIMQLASQRPAAIKAAVLNDIGPEIDRRGLLRIKKTLESMPMPQTWKDAAGLLRRSYEQMYPTLSDTDWMTLARKTYADRDGAPALAYDPRLRNLLREIDFDHPLPTLWPQFDALRHAPTMVIRGRNSDLLASETLVSMKARRADLAVLEVDNAGHAPLLADPNEIARISSFITKAEG